MPRKLYEKIDIVTKQRLLAEQSFLENFLTFVVFAEIENIVSGIDVDYLNRNTSTIVEETKVDIKYPLETPASSIPDDNANHWVILLGTIIGEIITEFEQKTHMCVHGVKLRYYDHRKHTGGKIDAKWDYHPIGQIHPVFSKN